MEDVNSYRPAQSFIVVVSPNVKSKEELLKELHDKLLLPDYFGFNWDALLDCLRDFHWIKSKKVVIIHTVIPHIGEDNLKRYLEILNLAIQDGETGDGHCLEAIFPESSEYALKAVINSRG